MNSLTRMPAPGTQQGGWWWDGSNWVCDPDCGPPGPPCPPSSFPPPGCPPWFPPPQGQPPWYPGANAGVSFSATAPPNPVRGNFWWDGKTLWMFDGAAWVAVGGTNTPLLGVTDGSNAPAGYVGEFAEMTVTVAYAASPTITNQTVSTLVLTAGDWNIWAYAEYTVGVGFASFTQTPQATGTSNGVHGQVGGGGGTDDGVMGSLVRGSFSLPTALPFQVYVDQSQAGLLAGTFYLTVNARRVR